MGIEKIMHIQEECILRSATVGSAEPNGRGA